MMRKVKRFVITFVFYLYFLVLGILFSLIVFPLVELLNLLFPGARKLYSSVAILFYRSVIGLLKLGRVIRIVSFEGNANLHRHKPCIYVSNHRTMLDVLIYLARVKETNCLIKAAPSAKRIIHAEENETSRSAMPGWWAPFIKVILQVLGYIHIPEEKNDLAGIMESFQACRNSLREGRSIIIFPEGTRSATGRLLPFLNLPFKLACEEKVPIVPLVIYNSIPFMQKGSIAIDIPNRVDFKISVLPPIVPDDKFDPQSLLMKVRRDITAELKRLSS
jgi:1-acyl-sn-glycerol-3-phosphate acyltransferase